MLSVLHGYQGTYLFTFLQCEPIVFTEGGKNLTSPAGWQVGRQTGSTAGQCLQKKRASQFLEKAPKYLHSFRSHRARHRDVALPNASILMTLSRRTKPTHGREIQTPLKKLQPDHNCVRCWGERALSCTLPAFLKIINKMTQLTSNNMQKCKIIIILNKKKAMAAV